LGNIRSFAVFTFFSPSTPVLFVASGAGAGDAFAPDFAESAAAALVAILARKEIEFILTGCLRTQSALGRILDVVLTAPQRN
jgi:hypothetical protein